MGLSLTQETIMSALDYAYDKALGGMPGIDSASDLALEYMKQDGSLLDQANALIRWQNTKSATSGFLTGLGGLLLMPATIPANLASVYFIQIRMIAAIAYMAGNDIRDDRVKSLIYACMAGNAAKEVLKDVGIQVGKKLTESAINAISREVIIKINRAVGFRLLTKAGTTGVVNLTKALPLVGGIIGGAVDLATTNIIGDIAVQTFVQPKLDALHN